MQQGLFLFPYIYIEGTFILDKVMLNNQINDNTSLIKIHKSLRADLLNFLDNIGINLYKLMPDLANICEAIKRNYE
jgi:hypothetical protein